MIALRKIFARWEFFLLAVLVATFLIGGHISQYFLTTSNVTVTLEGIAPIALLALTMTLIVITGEIDISVGSMVGLCASAIAVALEEKASIEVAMPIGIVVGFAAGAFNGLMVSYAMLPSLVVTIGTLALYRGLAQVILEERGISTFPDWYQQIGFGTVPGTPAPWSSLIFLILFAGFAVYLHRTHWGRALYAIGNNREAARFSGIDVKRTVFWLFVASGAMSALAAILLTAYLASARSDTATGLELPVITAVVLGGVNIFGGSGTMISVFMAVLVLAFVQNSLGLAGVTPEEQQIATGAVLVATLVVFSGSGFIMKLRETVAQSRPDAIREQLK
jgi:rhamnose transport system permease protein